MKKKEPTTERMITKKELHNLIDNENPERYQAIYVFLTKGINPFLLQRMAFMITPTRTRYYIKQVEKGNSQFKSFLDYNCDYSKGSFLPLSDVLVSFNNFLQQANEQIYKIRWLKAMVYNMDIYGLNNHNKAFLLDYKWKNDETDPFTYLKHSDKKAPARIKLLD